MCCNHKLKTGKKILAVLICNLMLSDYAVAEDIVVSDETDKTVTLDNTSGGMLTVDADISAAAIAGGIAHAIVVQNGSWQLINNNIVETLDGSDAIYITARDDVTITNDGTIRATGSGRASGAGGYNSISSGEGRLTLNNSASGIISAETVTGKAVYARLLTLSNSGTIESSNSSAIQLLNSSSEYATSYITNYGLIQGYTSGIEARLASGSVEINNASGGIISGTRTTINNPFYAGVVIYSSSTGNTDKQVIINNDEGAEISGGYGIAYSYAINNNLTLILNNNGLINGIGYDGIYGIGGTIINGATGIISGTNIGINTTNGGVDLYNAGTISGDSGVAIRFSQTGDYDNTLTLDTGSVINGSVIAGIGAGTDTLVLNGSGEEDGVKFSNFDVLSMNGTSWQFNSDLTLNERVEINTGSLTSYSNINTPELNIYSGASLTGTSTVNGNVYNEGTIDISAPDGYGTVTINGNYEGVTGSAIFFDTVLGDDSSTTDNMVINGNTSGTSTVYVANSNGSGGQTLEGIRLIEISGTSDAIFALGTRVVAGAYDYSLQKGTTSGTDTNSWYLTSYTDSTDNTDNQDETDSAGIRKIRPEASGYASNLSAANNMFVMSLHDRTGETRYTDVTTGEMKTTSMWLRSVGGRNKASMLDGQNKNAINSYVIQMGGDVMQWASEEAGDLHVGMMAGYGNAKGKTRNSLTGYSARNSTEGHSGGLYATWFQNERDKEGAWVDSWLLYSRFTNTVSGQELAQEKYKSRGMTASVEAGYALPAGSRSGQEGITNTFWLEPHVQAVWMGVKADEHTEVNGSRISGTGNDNVQTKLGLRAFINGKSAVDKNTGREFQPYLEANWLHNTQQYGVNMNGDSMRLTGSRNAGELKTGVEAKLSQNMSIWGGVSQQIGDKGYSDTQGNLGMRLSF